MRHPTKAWVVLADKDGPITGFELPNLVEWDGTVRREPIFFDLMNTHGFGIPDPIEFDLKLRNEGPFTQYTPNLQDQEKWTPADRMAIEPPTKELSE